MKTSERTKYNIHQLKLLFGLDSKYCVWEYGTCRNTYARRHKINKNVQMILNKAGHAGHKEDYWHNFDSSWWSLFNPALQG